MVDSAILEEKKAQTRAREGPGGAFPGEKSSRIRVNQEKPEPTLCLIASEVMSP